MSIAWAKRSLDNSPFNGDQLGFWNESGNITICLVDGLGHGENAEVAARSALTSVGNHLGESLENIFRICDQEVEWKVGVAMALAKIDEKSGETTYAAVGNIRGLAVQSKVLRLSCSYGIVGAGYENLFIQKQWLGEGDLLIMYSDGIQEFLDLTPDVKKESPQQLADLILAKYANNRDDAAVIVYKYEGPE